MFVLGFYFLAGLHVYGYFTVILYVLKKRLGTFFGLVWCAIGLSLLYNVFFNHFFATFIKPGSPLDLKVSEFPEIDNLSFVSDLVIICRILKLFARK